MRLEVFRLDLGMRRRLLLVYALGMSLYALIIVALYPTFEHSTGLDNLTKNSPTMAALFGATGSITSPSGWLEVNLYASFFPLSVLLATIGYGASSLAGQDEDGTLAMVTTLPIRCRRVHGRRAKVPGDGLTGHRHRLLSTAFIAIGYAFRHHRVGVGGMLGASGRRARSASTSETVAPAVGAERGGGELTRRRRALAAILYLVQSPCTGRPDLTRRDRAALYWSVGNSQLTTGISPTEVAVLVGWAIVLLAGRRSSRSRVLAPLH